MSARKNREVYSLGMGIHHVGSRAGVQGAQVEEVWSLDEQSFENLK